MASIAFKLCFRGLVRQAMWENSAVLGVWKPQKIKSANGVCTSTKLGDLGAEEDYLGRKHSTLISHDILTTDIWNEQHWPSCCHATFCSESERNGIRVEATLYQLSAETFGDQSKPWWCRHILITPVYQPPGQYALPYLEKQLFLCSGEFILSRTMFQKVFFVSVSNLSEY